MSANIAADVPPNSRRILAIAWAVTALHGLLLLWTLVMAQPICSSYCYKEQQQQCQHFAYGSLHCKSIVWLTNLEEFHGHPACSAARNSNKQPSVGIHLNGCLISGS